MKVSIQHDMAEDEFAKRFGGLAAAGYDEAHAALLRAQGIKPVSVETVYGTSAPQVPAVVETQAVVPYSPPAEPADLAPLYGLLVQMADMLTETRERLEARIVDQEKVNQFLVTKLEVIEQIDITLLDERKAG